MEPNLCCYKKDKLQKPYDYIYRNVSSSEIRELFKIKITQLKMVRARGYDISREQHILLMNLDQFTNLYIPFAQQNNKTVRSFLNQVYFKDSSQTNGLVVYYSEPTDKKTLSKTDFCTITQFLDEYASISTESVIIINKPLSSAARKCLQSTINYNISLFQTYELLIDPTEHYMVPKHEILSDYEFGNLLISNQDKNINIHDFPYIRTDDTIIKYLGGKPGQVVRVFRFNLLNTAISTYESYRTIITPGQQRSLINDEEEQNEEDENDVGDDLTLNQEEITTFDNISENTSIRRGRGRRNNIEYTNVVQGDEGTTGEFGKFGEFQGYDGFGHI